MGLFTFSVKLLQIQSVFVLCINYLHEDYLLKVLEKWCFFSSETIYILNVFIFFMLTKQNKQDKNTLLKVLTHIQVFTPSEKERTVNMSFTTGIVTFTWSLTMF